MGPFILLVSGSDLDYTFLDAKGKNTLQKAIQKEINDKKGDLNVMVSALTAKIGADAETPSVTATDGSNSPDMAKKNAPTTQDEINKALRQMSPTYVAILESIAQQLNLMPPSAAMAGLYTMTDNSRDVWTAPANIAVQGVRSPAVNISDEEQQQLNIDVNGKSVNAIRSFIGEGPLVWGARTLDGNSLDWQYINVRRTMIMLEQSVKLAAKAYMFEPNHAQTWLTVKSMTANFLTGIWKRGGLAGAAPTDAFSVYCGLDETMTEQDILEGYMRITLLVAITRPAEFIEINVQQQMQKS